MSGLYKFNHILEWKIPNQDDYYNVVNLLRARYEHMHSFVLEQFGPQGWLVLGLFAFFLLLIIIIYIKSIADTFRAGNEELADENAEPDGLFYTLEDAPVQNIANDNSNSDYLEEDDEEKGKENPQKALRSSTDELEKELSLSLLKASQENVSEEEQKEMSRNIKKRMKIHADIENARVKELKAYLKNKPQQNDENSQVTDVQKENLVGIIINLLGRGVSVPKINQSLYYNYKNIYDMHDIVHTVQSVCNFIGMCNAGKLDYLPQRQLLPENDAAIYAWANGDYSLTLVLLQAFLNQLMEQSQEENGVIKDLTYALASNCACIMGDITKFNDIDLAHTSFELATELSPKNITAWSRLGDIYMAEGAEEKAMIAYQNVMAVADVYMYAAELAHVKQQLAAYYKKQEIFNKAEIFNKESAAYYNDSGIYQDLTEKEILAYNTIYAESSHNLRKYIYDLLSGYQM